MSRKKLLLIGFIIIILIAIPLTIFLIKQQQDNRSRAEKATTVSFEPASTEQTPLQKNKNDPVALDVFVDPGTNQNLVSFVKLEINYDPAKLATGTGAFAADQSVMSLLEGPTYSPGKITATLSVGVDPTKVIQTKTKVATVTFTAIDGTGSTPTEVQFGTTTQVLSAGPNDQANENVLAGTTNAFITIAGDITNPTTAPTVPPSVSPSVSPSVAPSITTEPTAVPSVAPTATPSPTIIGATSAPNNPPACSALTLDRTGTGTAPFSITFTAQGSDSDGTINKVTFSYGDGQVDNITQGGGINTSTVNAATSHTYQNAGTYTASAVLTDNAGGVSSGTCSQTIVVDAAADGSGGGSSQPAPTDVASLPATGPGDAILGIGAVVGLLTAIGAFLFFAL